MKFIALILWLAIVCIGAALSFVGLMSMQPGRLLVKVGNFIAVDFADRFE